MNSIHGLSGTPEYEAYRKFVARCYNPSDKQYADYGGRGISVCERWRASAQNFLGDMGKRPSSLYSIDRIDNNGNYEPSNCRWATKSQQQQNRRKLRINTSGYIGVFWDKNHPDKFIARIDMQGKGHSLGRFVDPEQAALEYDKAVIFFRGDDGITNIL